MNPVRAVVIARFWGTHVVSENILSVEKIFRGEWASVFRGVRFGRTIKISMMMIRLVPRFVVPIGVEFKGARSVNSLVYFPKIVFNHNKTH